MIAMARLIDTEGDAVGEFPVNGKTTSDLPEYLYFTTEVINKDSESEKIKWTQAPPKAGPGVRVFKCKGWIESGILQYRESEQYEEDEAQAPSEVVNPMPTQTLEAFMAQSKKAAMASFKGKSEGAKIKEAAEEASEGLYKMPAPGE